MAIFVAKNETELDHIMSPETLMKSAPDYYAPRFEAIKALRDADDGTGYKGQEFRRVMSFVNVPLFMAAKLTDPDFLKNKRALYAYADRHPQYLTYDRRNGGRGTARDDLKLPLSSFGLDVPGAAIKVREIPVACEPEEAAVTGVPTEPMLATGTGGEPEHIPDSAEGTVGE